MKKRHWTATASATLAGIGLILCSGVHSASGKSSDGAGRAQMAEEASIDALADRTQTSDAIAHTTCVAIHTRCYVVIQYCVPVDWHGKQCAPSYACGACIGWWT